MNGIYIHIPYCVKKCGYCDFYSICDMSSADRYVDAVCQRLSQINAPSDTLYIGGGTPSLIGGERLAKIIDCAKPILVDDSEITVEVNPGDDMQSLLPVLAQAGVNRLSIGMQSHCDAELKLLTRRHNAADVEEAISIAKSCGINNISLDVMFGIEGQTIESLKSTLDFCATSGVSHVSAYMLKIENGTPFEKASFRPIDDLQADMYMFAVAHLKSLGYEQYEISNFSLPGKQSRHNLKYWICEPYIGIGAAAHSYYNGRRSYYPRSVEDFINGKPSIDDGQGGGFEERVMLGLRLTEGIDVKQLTELYPSEEQRVNDMLDKVAKLVDQGLVTIYNNRIALTTKGFLVSNGIINLLLE